MLPKSLPVLMRELENIGGAAFVRDDFEKTDHLADLNIRKRFDRRLLSLTWRASTRAQSRRAEHQA